MKAEYATTTNTDEWGLGKGCAVVVPDGEGWRLVGSCCAHQENYYDTRLRGSLVIFWFWERPSQ